MSDNTIKIETAKEKDGLYPITVDNPVLKVTEEDLVITFENKLDPDTDLIIEFFKLTEKGNTPLEVKNVCAETDSGTGTEFEVVMNKERNCKLFAPDDDAGFNYAYTVRAVGFQDLDPVLIIEPRRTSETQIDTHPTFDLIGLLLAASVGLVVGFLVGRIRK